METIVFQSDAEYLEAKSTLKFMYRVLKFKWLKGGGAVLRVKPILIAQL